MASLCLVHRGQPPVARAPVLAQVSRASGEVAHSDQGSGGESWAGCRPPAGLLTQSSHTTSGFIWSSTSLVGLVLRAGEWVRDPRLSPAQTPTSPSPAEDASGAGIRGNDF